MDIQVEKYALIEELMKVQDVEIVSEIRAILLNRNKVVGYQANGQPITTSQMKSDILSAKKRIESGRYTTQEDLEREVENW